jgi:hypothetical protein
MFQKISFALSVLVLSGFSIYKLADIGKVNAIGPCIITISGIQYDVAPLTVPGAHPGGNIFVCGTDMTALFMSMPTHAADIARMAPYIYIAPTSTPTPTVMPTSTPTPTVTPTTTPVPSVSPTITPTVSPTVSPSVSPTISPTVTPTDQDEDQDGEHDNNKDKDKDFEYHHLPENQGRSLLHRNNPPKEAGYRVPHEEK